LVQKDKVITISDFGTLKVSGVSKADSEDNVIWPSHPNTQALKTLIDLPGRDCFCFSDSLGNVHIYKSDTIEPVIKLKA